MRFLLVVIGLAFAMPTFAHGGGLNSCGCHVEHATGICHCHRAGPCTCACSCQVKEGPETTCKAVQARGGGAYRSSGKSTGSSTHVRGYTKKDGTYVAPHGRSAPNHTKTDNYTTKGNVNPYTGKEGTKNP